MRTKPAMLLLLAISAVSSPALAQSDCAGAIDRFRSIIDSDVATGNLNRSVYDSIQPGLRQAVALCQAGRAAAAERALQSLKSRSGYH